MSRQIKYNNGTYNIIANRNDVQEETFYELLIAQDAEYWFHHPRAFTKEEFEIIRLRRGFNAIEVQSLKKLCLFLGLSPIWE
jgi:hypothetical protein